MGIDHWHKCPGHQDIQADKRDPGNALQACGYARNDIEVIDNLVQRYIDGLDEVDTNEVVNQPSDDDIVEKKPVGCQRIKVWSEEPYYRGTIKYDASLRQRAGNSFDNYSFAYEKECLKRVQLYIFMKKFKTHKAIFGVELIHQVIMVGYINIRLK